MTTKTALKATIADDLTRSDITTQIGEAIDNAIVFYQGDRFYFNETRSATFVTVAGQSTYSVSDDADIPLWMKLDDVFLYDSSNVAWCMDRYDPIEMELLLGIATTSGRSYAYAYYEQSFRLYPVPNAVYTIRPLGIIKKAVPATDAEIGNVWMTDAYELIRCRAKAYLAAHTTMDTELLIAMVGIDGQGGATGEALSALRGKGSSKMRLGRITATYF